MFDLVKVRLSQVDDLILWLRLTRAILLVGNRQDPFALLPTVARQELDKAVADTATTALKQATMPQEVLAALYYFIDDQIRGKKQEDVADLSVGGLKDYLCYHLQEADQVDLADRLETALPEELRVGHATELFVAIVASEY